MYSIIFNMKSLEFENFKQIARVLWVFFWFLINKLQQLFAKENLIGFQTKIIQTTSSFSFIDSIQLNEKAFQINYSIKNNCLE